MTSDEIPHDKGEQRCQAVGGDAEGQVPTTGPARAHETPSRNSAAGGGCGDDDTYPQRYVDALNAEIANLGEALVAERQMRAEAALAYLDENEALRAKAEEYREGWVKCCFNASDAHALNRRMREFLHAYFIHGVLRFGERDGKPWTYREEARELLGITVPELDNAPNREGGGGGGSENLPAAEEKYNDPSSATPGGDR